MEKEKMTVLCEDVEGIANNFIAVLRAHGVDGMASLAVDEDGYISFGLQSGLRAYRLDYNSKLEAV